jgi:hypothetical protein
MKKTKRRAPSRGLRTDRRRRRAKAATAKTTFDWARLADPDSHRMFERLAGDLVTLECDDPNLYTPNATRSGKDGGADGLYAGKISGVSGPWKIASATRKTIAALETKIRAENRAAKTKRFKALLFITPFDLTPTDILRLSKVAGKGLARGLIWARGKLDQLLRKHPWVATYYLGHQLIPGFVPVDAASERDIAGQIDTPLVGRDREATTIEAFFTSPKRILLLVAPGGSGKSRLLRELAVLGHRGAPRRSVWLRRVGQGTIEESVSIGLPITTPIAIALDDAGRAVDELTQLARLATDSRPMFNVKLCVAIREADRGLVQGALGAALSDTTIVELKEIALEARAEIVKRDCPGLSKVDRERMARAFGRNLFLLRAAAQIVKEGRAPSQVVNIEQLRDLVAARLVKEAESLLSAVAPADRSVKRVLLELSLDVPVPRERMSDVMVATLRAAGILRDVGNTLRFRSDVEGDVLLGHLLREPWARTIAQAVLEGDVHQIPGRVRNLAAAGASGLVHELCQRWRSQFGTLTSDERHTVVEALPYCVEGALDDVADICRTLIRDHGATTDDVGPTLNAVSFRFRAAAALRFADDVGYGKAKVGMYSNYKLGDLDHTLVDLGRCQLEDVNAVCKVVATWIEEGHDDGGSRATLICAAIKPMLKMTLRINRTEAATLTVGEEPLAPTPAVRKMRKQALEIVKSLLSDQASTFRAAGADLVNALAHGEGAMVSSKAMLPLLGEDLVRLAPALKAALSAPIEHESRQKLTETLFFLWATDRPGARVAGEILSETEVLLAYQAFAFVTEPWEWRFDMREVLDEAPPSDRWSWWVHQRRPIRSEVDKLLNALVSNVRTTAQLIELVGQLPLSDRAFFLLDEWCDKAPELFREASPSGVDTAAGRFLQRVWDRRRRRSEPRAAVDDLRSAIESGDAAPALLLLEEARNAPPDIGLELVRTAVEAASVDVRAGALNLLRMLPPVSDSDRRAVCLRALRDGVWGQHFNVVWSVVEKLGGAVLAADAELAAAIKDRILGTASRRSRAREEWYTDRLIDAALPESDLAGRLAFVEKVLPSRDYGITNRCLGPFIAAGDAFEVLLAAGRTWIERRLISGASGLVDMIDSACGRNGVFDHITRRGLELLESGDEEGQAIGLELASLSRNDPVACARIADIAVESGTLQKRARQVLWRFSVPRGSYGRSFNEPAPALVALRRSLEQALSLVKSPAAADLIREQLRRVDTETETELRRDEEMLDPR